MSRHRATIEWALTEGDDFTSGRYSRGHAVVFERGHPMPGTASPHVVGSRWAAPGAVDPEEMLVASLSACHMLTFLHKARQAGFTVTRYGDEPEGVLEKDPEGHVALTRVTLRPRIAYAGRAPDEAERRQLHHLAHLECFIARSVKTEVVVEERDPASTRIGP